MRGAAPSPLRRTPSPRGGGRGSLASRLVYIIRRPARACRWTPCGPSLPLRASRAVLLLLVAGAVLCSVVCGVLLQAITDRCSRDSCVRCVPWIPFAARPRAVVDTKNELAACKTLAKAVTGFGQPGAAVTVCSADTRALFDEPLSPLQLQLCDRWTRGATPAPGGHLMLL